MNSPTLTESETDPTLKKKPTQSYGSTADRQPLGRGDKDPTRCKMFQWNRHRELEDAGTLVGSESDERLFEGTLQCPTCRGTGRIPRDQQDKLVALIPVHDNRLKPRRTTLYVMIAIVACLLIGGLLMFFLLPRSVGIASDVKDLKPLGVYINRTMQFVFLQIRNEYNITNNNFIPVEVTKLEVRVLFDEKVVVDATNSTVLHVPMRSTRLHSIDFNVTFDGDEGYIAFYCSGKSTYGHSILMPFQATASSSYYGHTEDTTFDFVQRVRCSQPS